MTAGLGTCRTLSCTGRRKTAPDTPTGAVTVAITNAARNPTSSWSQSTRRTVAATLKSRGKGHDFGHSPCGGYSPVGYLSYRRVDAAGRGLLPDGPLQEQPARHRVQPVRGLRTRPGCSAAAPSPTSTPTPPRRSCTRSTGSPARSSPRPSRPPTATRRSSTRPPTRHHAGGLQDGVPDATWTPSGSGSSCPRSSAASPHPSSLKWCVAEMVLGANPPVHLYSAGPGFAHVHLAQRHRARPGRSPST